MRKFDQLHNKLLLFYLVVGIFPLVVMGIYLATVVTNDSVDQSTRIYSQYTQQLKSNLLLFMDNYYDIGYDISHDKNVIAYLDEHSASDLELYNTYVRNIKNVVEKIRNREQDIKMRIYTPNETLRISGLFIRDVEKFNAQYQLLEDAGGITRWNGMVHSGKVDYLSFSMPVRDYEAGNLPLGVLEIMIPESDLYAFMSIEGQEQNIVMLVNDQGSILISNTGADAELESLAAAPPAEVVVYGGENYLMLCEEVSKEDINISGWGIRNLIPLKFIYETRWRIISSSMFIILCCIIIAGAGVVLFSKHITGRIQQLMEGVDRIRGGEQNVDVRVPGTDEITQLSIHFEDLLRDLDRLVREVYEGKLREEKMVSAQTEAQLLSLQSQINPHYLFNTMESIRMNLLLSGDTRTSEMVQVFSDSFRAMIYNEGHMAPLSSEVAFIERYFLVQKYRYEGKVSLQVEIEEGMPDYMILKALLQPLVENAVYHGLELKQGNGCIWLRARRAAGGLEITVEDDGVGMGEDELRDLLASIGSENGDVQNFALKNIAKRLKLFYEGKAKLSIRSVRNAGTTVVVRIPLELLEES